MVFTKGITFYGRRSLLSVSFFFFVSLPSLPWTRERACRCNALKCPAGRTPPTNIYLGSPVNIFIMYSVSDRTRAPSCVFFYRFTAAFIGLPWNTNLSILGWSLTRAHVPVQATTFSCQWRERTSSKKFKESCENLNNTIRFTTKDTLSFSIFDATQ